MSQLDDASSLGLDRSGMVTHAAVLGREFLRAWREMTPIAGLPALQPRVVALAGMGGSGAAAAYAAAVASSRGQVPCFHIEGPRLPRAVRADGLLIACSYSGMTPEVLSCVAEAIERGVPVIAVTAGGDLRTMAIEHGAAVVPITYRSVPRAALGPLLAGVMRAIEATGARPMDDDEVARAAASHRRIVEEEIGPNVPEQINQAKQFASSHSGGPTVIAAPDHLVPAARRMANQLAENAKCLALAASIPEIQHNLVETFVDPVHRPESLIVFDSALTHEIERRSVQWVAEMAQKKGIVVRCVEMPGESVLGDLLTATAFADLASCYLALARGIDPTPIPIIDALKGHSAADTASTAP